MALEQYNSERFSQETELMKKMNEFKGEADEFAVDTIKNLNEAQLTNFIEKSFKDLENRRETHSEMKQNKFYPFMVQASIDLLSDKLGNKKYDENGNEIGEEGEGGKTLDEYMNSIGGIDNKYGPGTKKIVKLVQSILGIHPDGFAGPQFFAKVCSVLKGEDKVSDFKVRGYDSERPYGYGFEDPSISTDTETSSTGNETILEDGTHTMELRDGLYEATLPKDFTLSQKEGNKDQYLLNYKGHYMGFIQLRNGIANLYCGYNMKENICNFGQHVNNKSVPHTIECLLKNKEKTEFYGKTFVMDYGIGCTKPDGQHSLNFLNQYGTYGGKFLIINEESGEPELLDGFSQTKDKELMKIKMEKDENDPDTYYINWA